CIYTSDAFCISSETSRLLILIYHAQLDIYPETLKDRVLLLWRTTYYKAQININRTPCNQ
ncbi:hypothetical protein, partial [Vibrio parahaemolyticus]|uniref:hypothetical protein n=1 Tax=Vibrio parahaemolyticus TaxID=670 RepID=UPI001A8C8776